MDPAEEAELTRRLGEVVDNADRLAVLVPTADGPGAGVPHGGPVVAGARGGGAGFAAPDEADDLEGECLAAEAVAANAPAVRHGFVAVPAVLVAGGAPAKGAREGGDG